MKRILLAEDEEAVRKYLALLLEKNDYKVKAVDNGKKALELIDASVNGLEEPFDLLITDIEMPLMDGFQVVEYVKNEIDSSIPIIVNTSMSNIGVVKKLEDMGVNLFIPKTEPLKIYQAVKSFMEGTHV